MRHSSLLIPAIDRVVKNAGMKVRDIDLFCVSIGPGSFTGLRIGVVTVKGLALTLNKRIAAIPTLDVIAYNAEGFKGLICPILDARKGKVYSCLYRSDGRSIIRLTKYMLIPAEELVKKVRGKAVMFLGDAAEKVSVKEGYLRDWYPRAEVAAALGAEYARKRKFVRAEDLEPMYLYSRECDITGR
jgi:tRNA threonylcarbamoyladenosine biosynthesis protein TsaB